MACALSVLYPRRPVVVPSLSPPLPSDGRQLPRPLLDSWSSEDIPQALDECFSIPAVLHAPRHWSCRDLTAQRAPLPTFLCRGNLLRSCLSDRLSLSRDECKACKLRPWQLWHNFLRNSARIAIALCQVWTDSVAVLPCRKRFSASALPSISFQHLSQLLIRLRTAIWRLYYYI